ncbi:MULTISPECIES: hypothetical protein [unclassified Hwanghaeella]|jgi:3-phenylpropionate/cinnamic acid dioxygenase small subunit|uniref:hypothetical protein n=1 Tax=unclassified Hwanghaeella TaxID=2605944 RepID=UPI000C976FA2|nr:hypothetical protein [Rhodospirillales bacterium]|tara:strand:- start:28539 stop:28979 length:441 start_codon:yes stop_codon:yes gene_type:complete
MPKTNQIAGARLLLDRYISALDQRDFQAWLNLYHPEGFYAVLRRTEYETGNNVLLVGEDLRRLRARFESGESRDKRRMLHSIAWIVEGKEEGSILAGFTLWLDGRPSNCGCYEMRLVQDDQGQMKIRRCTVILDGDVIQDTVYLPI